MSGQDPAVKLPSEEIIVEYATGFAIPRTAYERMGDKELEALTEIIDEAVAVGVDAIVNRINERSDGLVVTVEKEII